MPSTPSTASRAAHHPAVPAEVQAQIERTAAQVSEAMTQVMANLPETLAAAASNSAAPSTAPSTVPGVVPAPSTARSAGVPDRVSQDRTSTSTRTRGPKHAAQDAAGAGECGADGPGEATRLNRATRRELDKQSRAADTEERGLLAEIAHRNRAQLLPHYITAGLIGLAEAIHQLALQTHAAGALALMAGLAVAGSGAAGMLLLRRRQQLLDGWKLWAVMLSTATAVWMVIAVLHGVTWGTVATALVTEYAFASRWWRHHRHEQPSGLFDDLLAEIEAAPETEPELEISHELIDLFPRRWRDKVGCPGGVLAKSALVGYKDFAHGIEYILKLDGGKQDLAAVLAVLSKIASGLEHPASRLIAEPFLDEEGEENPSLVRFTVVTSSPVKDDVFFREPVLRKGYIPIGPYSDGRGMAAYQLFRKKRLLNGLIVGGTGSGKSRLLELIGLVAMWCGFIHVIHADGMNGASCPMLWEHTEHYGRDDADLLLERLEAMQAYREEELGRRKASGFRPSPELPGVLVIVDEAHRMITDKNWVRWSNLAREINKLAMGLVCADQDAKLTTWRDGTFRASLQAGNGIGLRVKDRAAGQIMDSGGFNLFDLPKKPGTGYVMESDDAEARQAPYRGQWLPDKDDAYPEDEETGVRATERQIPADVVLIEEWYQRAARRHVRLDQGTREAKDSVPRTGAPASAPSKQANTGAAGGAATTGQPDSLRKGAMAMPTVPTPRKEPAPTTGLAGMPTVPRPAAQAPSANAPGAGIPEQAAAALDEPLSDLEQRILDAVRTGLDKPSSLAEHLDLSRQYVAAGLRSLGERGLVDKTGQGPAVRYEATTQVA
jgi:hypothetical protein